MHRIVIAITLLFLNVSGILLAQKVPVDPSQRYFRIICLVHLTGSGQAGDPIVPEYVAQGVAVAQAAEQATAQAAANQPPAGTLPQPAARRAANTAQSQGTGPTQFPMSSRPGILGWGMQKSDDGTMAIVQMVAADHHAFDSILADTRPEIKVFEMATTPPDQIQTEMQKYKKDFDLTNFRVFVK